MDEQKCKKCSMDCEGYKCATCGVEAEEHDRQHGCGADQCQPKCSGCGEAEEKCSC